MVRKKMGIATSTNTRRISFNNNFALNPALNVQKSIEEDNNILTFKDLRQIDDEILFTNKQKEIISEESSDKDYWIQRMHYLKNEHQLINNIVEAEYIKTIDELKKVHDSPLITYEKVHKLKPCFNLRSKILQCYEENPHQSLICSAEVQAFSKYVTACGIRE